MLAHFRIEQVKHDDCLVRFYTGFITYHIFLAFFNFLGPVVHKPNYWGSKQGSRVRIHQRKLDPENQLFMVLVKLRLNLKTKELAFRIGLSISQVSRYLTTWVRFSTIIPRSWTWRLLLNKLLELFHMNLKDTAPLHGSFSVIRVYRKKICRGFVYLIVLCDHPSLVSVLFAVLLSLHLVTF